MKITYSSISQSQYISYSYIFNWEDAKKGLTPPPLKLSGHISIPRSLKAKPSCPATERGPSY